ncbi:AAA family ATPase [bacterium]|nr:AAA family ATPase [bacterium]MBU3955545.1 AAA family ATPase [bacterium]
MITNIIIENFKRLDKTDIDLSSAVVFAGPNNSGKTSALQAITLWGIGLRKWAEAKKTSTAKKRPGVAINRKDLFTIPIPSAKQLWKDLGTREVKRIDGKQDTKNINITIKVEGFSKGVKWRLGFEFVFANAESFYCKLINPEEKNLQEDIEAALSERIGLLPPMSGLTSEEDKVEMGTINSRIGEGKTADVLRNLCWYVSMGKQREWGKLTAIIKQLFGIELKKPEFDRSTGKIAMTYIENSKEFDLSNGGRGFHQILLLFSYIYSHENTVLLIDEPDAHLEILRQKEVFDILTNEVKKENSQVIIATHSTAVLNEAAEKSDIVAFIGKPHIVNNKSQLIKSLTTIGFDQYLLAEQEGWVLYLEGSTDLAILKSFAKVLNHPILPYLQKPFVKYITNLPKEARDHFYGLREGFKELKGVSLFDRVAGELQKNDLVEMMWTRREIENYLPIPEVIERYVSQPAKDLFSRHDGDLMRKIIEDEIPPAALKDKAHSWWINTKMSDEFLDKVFERYFKERKMPNLLMKRDYDILASFSHPDELDQEIVEKLDIIYGIAKSVVETQRS